MHKSLYTHNTHPYLLTHTHSHTHAHDFRSHSYSHTLAPIHARIKYTPRVPHDLWQRLLSILFVSLCVCYMWFMSVNVSVYVMQLVVSLHTHIRHTH